MKMAIGILCMLYTVVSAEQIISSGSTYRTCPTIYSCEKGTRPLTHAQRDQLKQLEKVIAPGTSADAISTAYRLKLDSLIPPTEVSGAPQLGRVHRATWYTTDNQSSLLDPHVDVYFTKDGAAWFKWYFEGFKFAYVEVSYVKK
jgi:hypothetical protein